MNSRPVPRMLVLVFAAAALAWARGSTALAVESGDGVEFFERHVRPLLAEKCFSCHGGEQRKGELSLDSRAGVLTGGERGRVVVPGKPGESLLVEAIGYEGDIQMPPDARLSEREIAVLREWVTLGVPWPEGNPASPAAIQNAGQITEQARQFWSFQAIRQPPLPNVQLKSWPRQPLDYFILSRLENEVLAPVTEADRRTYIRRATFDLLGLPPREEVIDEFVSDERPDAYERLIDRLLASPQYGERWARHWLDVARYGEDQAHTFEARLYPQGFRYRDWVLASLNRDLPMNQFLLEQIAGDLLPGEDRMGRLPALGFFALGPVYYADAGCAPKAKSDEYDDRIDTLTRGILGLTVSCARCHDHKFDPISMEDYYALAGVFASTEYVEAPLAAPEVVKAYEDAQEIIKQAEQRHKDAEAAAVREVSESLAAETVRHLLAAWRVQNHRKIEPASKIAAAVEGADVHEFLIERWLQYLQSESGKKHPSLKSWHDLVASQDATRDISGDPLAVAAIQQAAEGLQSQLLAAIETRRAAEVMYREQIAALPPGSNKPEQPALAEEVANLLKEFFDGGDAPLSIPKNRLEKLLAPANKQALAGLRKSIDELKQASPPKYPVAHSLSEGKVTNSKIHRRGNVADLGEEVSRRFLAILSPAEPLAFTHGSGRLELAQAVVSPENPLTARVLVNRVWQHHFGRGIVGTPSNFGMLGERPTHPELLDHLAAQFISSGWSLKRLHREIMLSATYRLAPAENATNQQRDPDNRLLWRMNRRRLDIESWRDATLQVAGNLDNALGGPSLSLSAHENRRRTLYAAISRHELNPVLRLFDFPDPNLTSERRSQTTVPMQQLFVLNSEFMVGQSRALAVRLDREGPPDDNARIDQLYGWVFGRAATDSERQAGGRFLKLGLPAGVAADAVKLTRWEQYAQALLSTNEFLFVD